MCPDHHGTSKCSNGVLVKYMLDSKEAQPSEGAVLTVTMANGSKALFKDVFLLDLMFTAEGGDRQVTVSLQLYVLDGL